MSAIRNWFRGLPRSRRRGLVGGTFLAVAGTLGALWLVPLPHRLSQPPSTVVAFRDGSPAFVFLAPDDRYRLALSAPEVAVALRAMRSLGPPRVESVSGATTEEPAIDPAYLTALLRYEDKRFFLHHGVDPLAIVRSAWINLRSGAVRSGASTLTMQLVRLIEPRPRTMFSKVVEALRATQIEAHLSKQEVLAAYLNFLPFGRNVEGVVAASWSYFGHGPQRLTSSEISVLLAVPQRPASRFPTPEHQPILRQARDEIGGWLINQGALRQVGLESGELLHQVHADSVPRQLGGLPRELPHLAFWLRTREPRRLRFDTTLDRGLQRAVERRVAGEVEALALQGIHNGAVVVVENETRALRALVGNFDFWQGERGGQIAAFDVGRSPGSVLKPFLYALAIDRAVVLPEQLVLDVPLRFRDYEPNNYDGHFAGLVSIEDALAFSLNVPFVSLLQRVGVDSLLALLRAGGATRLRAERGYYGLSAAIGALEITPLEVASLYVTLAQDGRMGSVRWLAEDLPNSAAAARRAGLHGETTTGLTRSNTQERLFSAGTSWLVRRALERRDRPDFPERRRMSGAPAEIFWKTGTSYGHRDAWSAGGNGSYTVVVWLGNLDNEPAADLVGAAAAGPLFFDVVDAVGARPRLWNGQAPPQELGTVVVCSYSGYRQGAACPATKGVLARRALVPTELCPFHRVVETERQSGLVVLPGCREGKQTELRQVRSYPATLERWLRAEGKWLPEVPALHPDCRRDTGPQPRSKRLAILSPRFGEGVALLPGIPPSDQEIPLRAEGLVGEEMAWFVDGRFFGRAAAGDDLWWTPLAGVHEFVVEAGGSRAKVELNVRALVP